MNKPTCAKESCAAVLEVSDRYTRFRRAGREVNVRLQQWRCDRCADPETGAPPLVFTDQALGRENDAAIQVAWRERYGEDIPPRMPPGRKPETPERESLLLTMSSQELSELDRARGKVSRSAFIRQAISERLRRMAG